MVVGVVGECDVGGADMACSIRQRPMTQGSSRHFHRFIRGALEFPDRQPSQKERELQAAGQAGHKTCVGIGLNPAKPMVGVQYGEVEPGRFGETMKQVKQDHGIEAAGNGHEELAARAWRGRGLPAGQPGFEEQRERSDHLRSVVRGAWGVLCFFAGGVRADSLAVRASWEKVEEFLNAVRTFEVCLLPRDLPRF